MEIISQTLDDAIGEAVDKSAKMLGVDYPGGPLLDEYAQKGNPHAFPFTKPKVGSMDFSISGLKTAVLYFLERKEKENPNFIQENIADICASIQFTIVDYVMEKLKNAVKETGIKEIAIGGGVSANSGIRNAMLQAQDKHGWKDRKSTRLNSSHVAISYAVVCLKKKI